MIQITDCDRHLTKQNLQFPEDVRKDLRWEAIKTLNKRSLPGIFFLYVGLVYLGLYIPVLPGYEDAFSSLFVLGLALVSLRLMTSYIVLNSKNIENLRRFEISFFLSISSISLYFSLVMACLLHVYGFEWYTWLFFIYLACVTVGAFSSFCFWRKLAITYILLVMLPTAVATFTLFTDIGNIVGVCALLYCLFILIQVRVWNKEYWDNRIHQYLQNQRTEELVEEKLISDQANQTKSKFLSSMSHELRTPLNAILGFSQLLRISRHSDLNEYQQKNVDQIIRSGELLLGLIDSVLDFSRMESGRTPLNPEAFFPNDVMRENLEMLRNIAKEKEVTLNGKRQSNKGIYADRLRFKQVMVNLMTNAIKYNNRGGHVEFGCIDLPNGNVEIYVEDTGKGIAQNQLDNIFEPFERLDAVNSQIEGTGIGLTISKKLIETMGGKIHVSSEEGIGSRFSIEMQAADPDMISKESQPVYEI
ncbi:sensor histidine kinase [Curvivirga sp.]|uniref:sensor histidine kinase n=1 Tax=Curvivirga sp. TaxID=2856848 RepID=UPI003B58CF9E